MTCMRTLPLRPYEQLWRRLPPLLKQKISKNRIAFNVTTLLILDKAMQVLESWIIKIDSTFSLALDHLTKVKSASAYSILNEYMIACRERRDGILYCYCKHTPVYHTGLLIAGQPFLGCGFTFETSHHVPHPETKMTLIYQERLKGGRD